MQINSAAPAKQASLPWYRYGMVWMVIALPLIVVIASLVTISIAFSNSPEVIPRTQQQLPQAEIETNASPVVDSSE